MVGYYVSHHGSRDMAAYFLGGNKMPWYVLGISNASGMFDISGTMLLVYWMFVYGLKSVWIPWLWPTFNQIFLMVYLSAWLRRSNVMTGAEWIKTRFGTGRGAQLSHLIVVIYAFVSIIGFFSYGFKGIGKFAATFLPWHLSPNEYALILIGITAIYVIKGGMISVVITEVVQFFILSIASFAVGIIAMMKVAPELLHRVVPAGWDNIFFGWHLNLDWSTLLPAATRQDCRGRLWAVRLLRHDAVLQGRADLRRRAGAQLRHAARAFREEPARSLDDERLGQHRAHLPALLSRHRTHRAGRGVLQPQPPRHGHQHGLRTGAALCAWHVSCPSGLLGFLIAGLLAAFMSNFAATVNAAPPYFVNDIYKRYINPDASPKTYVRLSYLSSFAVVVIGVLIGWNVTSVNSVVIWIVSGLWGGYTASNVLKWYWWRFNGYGYFWGMVAGIASALALPTLRRQSAVRPALCSPPIPSIWMSRSSFRWCSSSR